MDSPCVNWAGNRADVVRGLRGGAAGDEGLLIKFLGRLKQDRTGAAVTWRP